jgi:hypothetical protein
MIEALGCFNEHSFHNDDWGYFWLYGHVPVRLPHYVEAAYAPKMVKGIIT